MKPVEQITGAIAAKVADQVLPQIESEGVPLGAQASIEEERRQTRESMRTFIVGGLFVGGVFLGLQARSASRKKAG
jgi:hypothetical protein